MQSNELDYKGMRWLLDWRMILARWFMFQAFVIAAGHCPNGRHLKPSVSTRVTRWCLGDCKSEAQCQLQAEQGMVAERVIQGAPLPSLPSLGRRELGLSQTARQT